MKAYFRLSRSGAQFHFVLRAPNHRTILSSERYTSEAAALKGIESVRRNAVRERGFVRKQARNGEPMFNLQATNGEVVGTSETYRSKASREKGIASVMVNAPRASVVSATD